MTTSNRTRIARRMGLAALLFALPLVPVGTAAGQGSGGVRTARELDARVSQVRDGRVRLTFATRPDVCGQGQSIHRLERGEPGKTRYGQWDGNVRNTPDVEWDDSCERGPGRLVLTMADGKVTGIRTYVGGRWRPVDGTVDLGAVPAPAVSEWLVSLAERPGFGRGGRDAVFPATLADSSNPWPSLLRLARNEAASSEARKNAVFWLGQAAGDAVTKDLDELVGEQNLDRGVQESAVFALSQRPSAEGVPVLIRVARTHRDPKIRRSAMFWLGQSKDPRAVALFEELLTKGR